MEPVIPSCSKTSSSSNKLSIRQKAKRQKNEPPLPPPPPPPPPSTLILTPLRSEKEENSIEFPCSRDGVSQRPVLTLTCYPSNTERTRVETAQQIDLPDRKLSHISTINSKKTKDNCTPNIRPHPETQAITGKLGLDHATKDKNTMNSSSPELVLGRNQTTLISHNGISRSAATITCKYDATSSVFEFRMSAYRSSMVSINGRSPRGNSDHGSGRKKRKSCVVIKMGDIISLHDREGETEYRYRADVLTPHQSGENACEDADGKPPSKVSVKEDSSVVSADSTIGDCATAQPKRRNSAVEDDGSVWRGSDLRNKALRALYSQKSSCTKSSIGSKIADAPGVKEDPAATFVKEGPVIMALKYTPVKLDPDSKDPATEGAKNPHTEGDTHATTTTNIASATSTSTSTSTTTATSTSTTTATSTSTATATATTTSTSATSSTTPPPHPPTPTPEETQLQKIKEIELERQERLDRQRNRRVLAIERLQSTARQHTLDELTCSICMEILVRTHVAHPCGHLFCGPCIERMTTFRYNEGVFLAFQPQPRVPLKNCPTCRVEITSCALARSYDNVIWNMVLMGTVFQGKEAEDDLKQFLVRSGREMEKLSPIELDCIFGRHHRRCGKRKGVPSEETVLDKRNDDVDDDEIKIVKRVRTNRIIQTFEQQVSDILDLTEPIVTQGTNIDDPICL